MTYADQLRSAEWQEKRREIILRDFCCCQLCGNTKVVKSTNKVDGIINEFTDSYRVLYKDTERDSVKHIFLPKSSVTFNVLYLENLRLHFFEVYKEINNGIDTITAIRERDMETVLSNSPVAVESNLLSYARSIDETQKHKRWLFVPGLNVHHRYYIKGKKAWEYENTVLVTLCKDCHEELHSTNQVPYYSQTGHLIKNLPPCSRCGGLGLIPHYLHIDDGICYKCGGSGYQDPE